MLFATSHCVPDEGSKGPVDIVQFGAFPGSMCGPLSHRLVANPSGAQVGQSGLAISTDSQVTALSTSSWCVTRLSCYDA